MLESINAGVQWNRFWETLQQEISKVTSCSEILCLSKSIEHEVPLYVERAYCPDRGECRQEKKDDI